MSDPGHDPGSIEETETFLRLGATVSGAQAFARLAALDPKLGEVVRRLASVGAAETFWGDLMSGSPSGDLAACLIALGAWVELHRRVDRRVLPLEYFLSQTDPRPEEFITSLTTPKIRMHERFYAQKAAERGDKDFSTVLGAFKFEIRDGRVASVRIAFDGLGKRPTRAATTEAFAIGLRIAEEETWRSALDALSFDFSPAADARGGGVARELFRSALLELRGELGSDVG